MSFPEDIRKIIQAAAYFTGPKEARRLFDKARSLEKLLNLLDEIDTKPIIVTENIRAQIRALAEELRG